MIAGTRQVSFLLFALAAVCTFGARSEGATWEQNAWRSTAYYRNTFEAEADFSAWGYPFNRSALRPQSCVRPTATAGLPPGAPGSWDGLAVWAARGAPSSVVGWR